MKSVITLGKKQVTELLKAYNKGVKSTFGLQKSRHQFAQALKFSNWFELDAQLEDSAGTVLSPNMTSHRHRIRNQYLDFTVRLPDYEAASNFFNALTSSFRLLLESGVVTGIDQETLKRTFLKVLPEGYSDDEMHMAPTFVEVMEWYAFDESMTEENVYSYAFDYGEWDQALVRQVVDGILKPVFRHFLSIKSLDGEFISAQIVREFRYQTETPV